jgi:hypothetical protein
MKRIAKRGKLWELAPLFGAVLFLCLYYIATLYYPGGSQADKNSNGFSWINNYWCNLLNQNAINEQPNPAKPIAIAALVVLCSSLAIFWYLFPQKTDLRKNLRLMIQISGGMAMLTTIFTKEHDAVVNIASLFGLFAMGGTIAGLYQLNWRLLFWLGIFNLVLVAVNNVLYYTNGLIIFLPLIQKTTFLFFLLWVSLVTIRIYKR